MENDFLRKTMELLKNKNNREEMEESVRQFFGNLGRIGQGEIKLTDSEIKTFLSETSSLMNAASLTLHRYLFATEVMLTNEFYGDEWISVCKRRSNIEFLRNLYHDVFDPDWNFFLNCENLDDMLQQKGDFEGRLPEDQIPEGIPTSHWWWWYPGSSGVSTL